MKFQIISDLHLEYNDSLKNKEFFLEPVAEYLALLGDIGYPKSKVYQNFISECSKKFKLVIIICGNHEYYRSSYEKINSFLDTFVKNFNNVVFLNNNSIYLEGFKILGTTLWSNIPNNEKFTIESQINDYKYIRYQNFTKKITSDITNQWHQESINWLKKELQEDIKIIVLSHHCPLKNEITSGKYFNSETNSAFCTDLSAILHFPIVAWAYGHTHINTRFSFNEIIICSNQYGYDDEMLNIAKQFNFNSEKNFKGDFFKFVLEIPDS